jgi:hypothetical protein
VVARKEFENGLFLGGVELEPDRGAVVDEGIDEFVWFGPRGRQMVEKGDARRLAGHAEAFERSL